MFTVPKSYEVVDFLALNKVNKTIFFQQFIENHLFLQDLGLSENSAIPNHMFDHQFPNKTI